MRYAVFSDVHANLRAWEQVLADICEQQVDVLVCLGDVVGYGPRPEEVLRGIQSITDNFVMGNHDAAAAGVMDYSMFNEQAQHSIEWTSQSLSEESREFLGSVPLAIDAGEILFVHAEILEPGRFAYIDCLESAEENFSISDHFVTFVGHTHQPNIFQLGEDGRITEFPDNNKQLDPACRYIVNVGSVGEPRIPDDLRGVYVVYDSETRIVDYRKVAFDIEAYRRDLESTTLGIKPFFLQSYEHQMAESHGELLSASHAMAMEAPAVTDAFVTSQTGPVQLHIPSEPLNLRVDQGLWREEPEKPKKRKALLFTVFVGVLVAGVATWKVLEMNEKSEPPEVLVVADATSIIPKEEETGEPQEGEPSQTPSTGTNEQPSENGPGTKPPAEKGNERGKASPPKPEPEKPAPEPVKSAPNPKPLPNPVVALWRMEENSSGGDLIDSRGRHTLSVETPGTKLGSIAPEVVPANGKQNQSALGLGVWNETAPQGVFELRSDRSFTFEGWVITDRSRAPIFVAGTRSGDANEGQGWHIDIRPPSNDFPNGQMSFFYDNGPEIFQALSGDVTVADLQPHHFAAVWDHDSSASAGEMRLFLDGERIAMASIPHAQIANEQANLFRIGSTTNPPRIGLDEIRFSRRAFRPSLFLSSPPEIVLLEEDFEAPDVTGFKQKSTPSGWVGSNVGFGSTKRGLIDKGDGSQFSTTDGQQAFHLAYANTGLTSKVSSVKEVLTADRTYKVTFHVGAMKGEKSDYLVELVAFEPKHDDAARGDASSRSRPGIVLAKSSGTTNTYDLSQKATIVFKAESTSPHLGKRLGVRFARLAHNGSPIFDKVRLTSKAETFEDGPQAAPASVSPPPSSAGKDPAEKSPAPPGGSRPKSDPTFAWWRMEGDSAGPELVDSKGRKPLPVLEEGKPISALAPPVIPSNGVANDAAMGLGVWGESKPNLGFSISPKRSFTLEGWFLTARPRAPIFLAGTRSGESNQKQGWHVDIRPGGFMCFFYDNGPENIQALSEELPAGDFAPHHFAAVWDHDAGAAAGELRLYFDGDLVASSKLHHGQIPEAPANPFRIGATTNPPRVGLDEVRFSHVALSPLEFLRAEIQSMVKNGEWTNGANWSAGEPPSGTQTAVVGSGVVALVQEAPADFAGDLVLKQSAKMEIKTPEAFAIVPAAPSKIVLNQGSEIIITAGNGGSGNELKRIELAGNATVWGGRSTQGHHTSRVFAGEISGKGALILDGVNNNKFVLATPNRFEGGLVAKTSQKQGFHVVASVPGSLGKGNVEIRPNVSLVVAAEGGISQDARLKLLGQKDSRSASKVILNADNTVQNLVIENAVQKAGTWGAVGSGADNESDVFSGTGILTVRR